MIIWKDLWRLKRSEEVANHVLPFSALLEEVPCNFACFNAFYASGELKQLEIRICGDDRLSARLLIDKCPANGTVSDVTFGFNVLGTIKLDERTVGRPEQQTAGEDHRTNELGEILLESSFW